MDEKVKAAMERWVGAKEIGYTGGWSDARDLADAFVALYDETPLNPDYLRSCGWDVETGFKRWRAEVIVGSNELVLYEDGVMIIAQGPDESITVPAKITTRGQLLRLLEALGVGSAKQAKKCGSDPSGDRA